MGNCKYDCFEKVQLDPCEEHEFGKTLDFFLHFFQIVHKVLNLSCQHVDNLERLFHKQSQPDFGRIDRFFGQVLFLTPGLPFNITVNGILLKVEKQEIHNLIYWKNTSRMYSVRPTSLKCLSPICMCFYVVSILSYSSEGGMTY